MNFIHKIKEILLYLPWIIALGASPLLIHWYTEDTPLSINYAHKYFLSAPATNREEAKNLEVTEVRGGSIVYRYIEYCVSKPFTGHVQRSWQGSAIVWAAPDTVSSKSLKVGCDANSFAIEVPTSSPTRSFDYSQRMYIKVNPIRTDVVEYSLIPLRILSPMDADRLGK